MPFASPRLLHEAGQAADRFSINIELPSEKSLQRLTHDKTFGSVLEPMGIIREKMIETCEDQKRFCHVPAFSPAERTCPDRHRQVLPKRYWQYLTEKQA